MKELKWSNGVEWGEIYLEDLDCYVMTYWKEGTPCYDTYTAPMVTDDNDIITYRFCQDSGQWVDCITLGEWEGEETCKFG